MTINIDDKGNIFIHQGDSGEVVVTGLNTDKNYQIYFAVKNSKREPVGSELVANSDFKPSVTFFLNSSFTNLFTVPSNEEYEIYHYGIKSCFDDIENTLQVEGVPFGSPNNIIVFPKKVEGL